MLRLKNEAKEVSSSSRNTESLLEPKEILLEQQNLFAFSMQCFHKPVFIRRKTQYYEVFKPGLRLPQL